MHSILNKKVKDTQDFLTIMKEIREENRVLKEIRPRKRKENDLLDSLLALDDPSRTKQTIDEYWGNFWKAIEDRRFSQESKNAYSTLKRILKYNLYEKRGRRNYK